MDWIVCLSHVRICILEEMPSLKPSLLVGLMCAKRLLAVFCHLLNNYADQ